MLSPILLIVYFDELILLLKKGGLGCHVHFLFVDALGYADDLTLLCPSLRELDYMLDICAAFAEEYNVPFNTNKTMCIKLGSQIYPYDKVYLSSDLIQWVDKVKYLGNTVQGNLSDIDR